MLPLSKQSTMTMLMFVNSLPVIDLHSLGPPCLPLPGGRDRYMPYGGDQPYGDITAQSLKLFATEKLFPVLSPSDCYCVILVSHQRSEWIPA